MTEHFDVVIRQGLIVSPGFESVADLGISDGKIAQIGGEMSADREINAAGKYILPGGIDAHVHLSLTEDSLYAPGWCDDFTSGTSAAAAGGLTVVGNMTFPRGSETMWEAIQRESADANAEAIVDVILHPVLTNPATQPLSDIARLADEGVTTLKYFMSFGGFAENPTAYMEAMREARDAGCLTLIHCEDHAILTDTLNKMVAEGRVAIENYPESRSVTAEAAATARAVSFAEETGAPIYIVHLSSAAALEEVRRGRSRGVKVWIETRPLYLHLTEERFSEEDGAKYVGQPPLRKLDDRIALWRGLAAGEIDTLCTDHAPWKYADKVLPGMDIVNLRPGVADLDTMLPMLFSEGVIAGRITLQQFVNVSSTNAAKLFGLFPRKGTIAIGSDADVVIWDPNLTKPVRAAEFKTNSDYSPYEGWEVTGWPITTIHAGEVIFDNGEITAKPGRAGIIKRERTRAL